MPDPSDDVNLAVAAWTVNADGDVEMTSQADWLYLGAQGENTSFLVDANNTASIYCGPAQFVLTSGDEGTVGSAALTVGIEGTIEMLAGPPFEGSFAQLTPETLSLRTGVPDVGALISMTPESIKLSVGVPGVGASIELTPESIIFRVAEVVMTITPEGITEEVAEVTREVTPEGHNFTAAETELNVGVEGMMYEGPTAEAEVEAAAEVSHSLANITTEGVKAEEAALLTVE